MKLFLIHVLNKNELVHSQLNYIYFTIKKNKNSNTSIVYNNLNTIGIYDNLNRYDDMFF